MGGKQTKTIDVLQHTSSAQAKLGLPQLGSLQQEWNKHSGPKGATFEQFKKLMHQLDEAELKRLYNLYDLDHDNCISWIEFVCCIVIISSGTVEDKLSLIFNSFDKDLNGKISKSEFKKAVAELCAPFKEFEKKEQKEFINKVFKEVYRKEKRALRTEMREQIKI
eukprot:TRINITY_DN3002_c0_g1_i3.p1 TRINITY_DN3002_c0_g1~~TRINITY_DN3002_c0_g1_i3.p1  ORF type:complete len:165 (-),score=29.47 TRINITY_DN3002_c0_g1_i3:44-538(-)